MGEKSHICGIKKEGKKEGRKEGRKEGHENYAAELKLICT